MQRNIGRGGDRSRSAATLSFSVGGHRRRQLHDVPVVNCVAAHRLSGKHDSGGYRGADNEGRHRRWTMRRYSVRRLLAATTMLRRRELQETFCVKIMFKDLAHNLHHYKSTKKLTCNADIIAHQTYVIAIAMTSPQ
ncbi:Sec14p-like phosphatidylinositol transfer family protein [Striga asiatica]|uniref:Sec14p-like phosphatidylinositol transfer family protein n=1 Tax=Striga asiatica TaxID=4170 RepID=A0A5A7QHE3_STRAF|nr:Sec14p-like phosphatidylinositol transfer family protein [Striga asiatica]